MVLRKAGGLRNFFVPINKLPTEIVVHVATFFAKERDLVNATAVCQHWRTILLSSPQLWCNAGGSSSEIQAYMERSGSMPIIVDLFSPELAELIAPHTSRLIGLTMRAHSTSSLDQVARHLRRPIPTLQSFRISTDTPGLHKVGSASDVRDAFSVNRVDFGSDVRDAFFVHSKKLDLEGITSFFIRPMVSNTSKAFPHVAELIMRSKTIDLSIFLGTLEHLPTLERVSITFIGTGVYGRPRVITLPQVQEMNIFAPKLSRSIPPILHFKPPNLASLHLQISLPASGSHDFLSRDRLFEEYLQSLADLPELLVTMDKASIGVTFRNPRAAFRYVATDGFRTYRQDRVAWGALPFRSVRRLTVDVRDPREDADGWWFVELLRDLVGLEHLEFRGEYPRVAWHLCLMAAREEFRDPIRSLVERAVEGYR